MEKRRAERRTTEFQGVGVPRGGLCDVGAGLNMFSKLCNTFLLWKVAMLQENTASLRSPRLSLLAEWKTVASDLTLV
jgi:hypothetical protein